MKEHDIPLDFCYKKPRSGIHIRIERTLIMCAIKNDYAGLYKWALKRGLPKIIGAWISLQPASNVCKGAKIYRIIDPLMTDTSGNKESIYEYLSARKILHMSIGVEIPVRIQLHLYENTIERRAPIFGLL